MLSRSFGLLFVLLLILIATACTSAPLGQAPTAPAVPGELSSEQPGPALAPTDRALPERDSQIVWTATPEGEPNDSTVNAVYVTDFHYVDGSVDSAGDQNDYYYLGLDEPGCIYAKLGWSNPDAHLNFYLYDSEVQPVDYDSTMSGSPKDVYAWEAPNGLYYLRVKASWGASSYRLKVAALENIIEPENDTIETMDAALPIAFNTPWRSAANSELDENDYYKVDIDTQVASGILDVNLDWFGPPDPNFNVYLYEEDYTPVAYSNGSAQPEVFTIVNPPEGTFYIRVKAFSGAGVYELTTHAHPVYIFNPKELYEYVYPPIPWPDPDPAHDILDKFDPEMFEPPPFDVPPQYHPLLFDPPDDYDGWGADSFFDVYFDL